MKLIVISPSKTNEKETKQVTALFEHGLKTFHLRKPTMRTKDMKQYLEEIPTVFHNRIVIHSHHKLAMQYDLKGIHLNRIHFKKRFILWWRLRTLLLKKPETTVTTTFHKLSSVYSAEGRYYYAFLGTIFDRMSGKFNSGFNEYSLRASVEKSPNHLVARGGTDVDNIEKCHSIGFTGMVFSSAVWKAEDPAKAYCAIVEKFRSLNIPIE